MVRLRSSAALVLVLSACVAGAAPAAADEPWRDAEPAAGPARRRVAGGDDPRPEGRRWRSATSRRWRASAYRPCPPTTGPAASAPTARRRSRRRRRWRRPSTATLARAYGEAIGAEARGKGFNWWLGPAMDIARTPLAGRQPENLGEDPFLAGETVAQEVAGAKSRHVIATLKHYVANNAEWGRIGFNTPTGRSGGVNAIVSERALQEIYEAPFKRAIRESAADAVMCSYNRLNGPQTCESPALLSDLKASGFDGFVAPDFIFAVKDPLAATLAGLDVPALGGPAGGRPRCSPRARSRPRGWTTSSGARCSRCSTRAPSTTRSAPPAANVSTPEHQALATKVSASGMVLLKNDAPRAAARRARAALDRGDRPLGRRRGLHQRRLVGRAAGPGRHRHAAGRDPRARRIRRAASRRRRARWGRAADGDRARATGPASRRRTGTAATSPARPR